MSVQVPIEHIDAARKGGQAEVERLLEMIWPHAYRLARSILGNRQMAEDAAQETCVLIFGRIASLRHPEAFATWFYRIVVRTARKLRKTQTDRVPLLNDVTWSDDCCEILDLEAALGSLSERLRTVLVLYYFEGLSSRQIGKILHVPDATIRFRLMTAKRLMQPMLAINDSPVSSKGKEQYAL